MPSRVQLSSDDKRTVALDPPQLQSDLGKAEPWVKLALHRGGDIFVRSASVELFEVYEEPGRASFQS